MLSLMNGESINESSLFGLLGQKKTASAASTTTTTVDLEPLCPSRNNKQIHPFDANDLDHHQDTTASVNNMENNHYPLTDPLRKDIYRTDANNNKNMTKGRKTIAPSPSINLVLDSNYIPPVNKGGNPIFRKKSPHYQAFIDMCNAKGWTDHLPMSKHDPDLQKFCELTGYDRSQVNRKFNEYRKSQWESTKEKQRRRKLQLKKKAELAIKEQQERDKHKKKEELADAVMEVYRNIDEHMEKEEKEPHIETPGTAKRTRSNGGRQGSESNKQQRSDIALDETILMKDTPLVAQVPPLPLPEEFEKWQQQQSLQRPSLETESSLPLPPPPLASPVEATSSTFSDKSLLRTLQFHDIPQNHDNDDPLRSLLLDRNSSWSSATSSTLQPPNLNQPTGAEEADNTMLQVGAISSSHPRDDDGYQPPLTPPLSQPLSPRTLAYFTSQQQHLRQSLYDPLH